MGKVETHPHRLRLAGYLFPPGGLLLLWRGPKRIGKKILGTIGLAIYTLLYAGIIGFLLIRFTGLQIEWRGGYLPALTYRKTRPDYDALDRSRQAHKNVSLSRPQTSDTNSYWIGFRGPNRDGHFDETQISTNWPANGLKLLWRQPIGGGYASFAIANGLAFTLEQRREKEALVAYDLQTGAEIWVHDWPGEFHDYYAEGGPRATPAYSEGKIYGLGALGTLHCVDAATGKLIWSREILAENHADLPTYGVAASPLILNEKIIVLSSAGHGHSVLCFDKENGKPIWSALDDVTGYASPVYAELCGEGQLIICCGTRTVGLSPAEGKLLWEYAWHVKNNQLPIAQTVLLGTNRFMLSAGYFTGCAAVEVDRNQNSFTTRTLWQNSNLKNKFTSSVYHHGYIYGLDEDILTCLDAANGERKWKEGRYGYGQVLLAGDYLVISSASGELALVKATPERHEELARFQAIIGKTWNYPALGAGKLLIRNSAEMACFDFRR